MANLRKTEFSWVIIWFLLVVMISGAAINNDRKSIDEIIMDAATHNSVNMLDLFHDLGDGKLMTMVELDIMLNATELAEYRSHMNRYKRKAWKNTALRWPDRTVPYEITNDFNGRERSIIEAGVRDWEEHTCLRFIPVSNNPASFPSRIVFRNGGGCYSRLGRTGTAQPISLGNGCRTRGIVVHEIGHAIGWIHEQARPDRDDYISINFNQIPENWHPQYRQSSPNVINNYNVEYDYTSIMHYSGNTFGPRTIITRDPAFQDKIGQRTGLSFRDVKIANLMYHCSVASDCPTVQCPGEGFQDKNCQCRCPTKTDDLSNPTELCDMTVTTRSPPTRRPPTRRPVTRRPATRRPVTRRPATRRPVTRRPTTTTSTTTESPVCRDLIRTSSCERFKEDGECQADAGRMMMYCKKTCGFCSEDPNKMCMDFDDACPFVANSGYCDRPGFSALMKSTCPKSCKLCVPSKTPCSAADFSQGGNGGNNNLVSIVTMIGLVALSCL